MNSKTMAPSTVNESDYDSPGYEFMRSHVGMNNLYHKIVALGYHVDFCRLYKCPPIHRYYFLSPSKNQAEQLFLYTCLCAWLIKDKCQMNLDIDPEEYENPETIIGSILEAIGIILTPDDGKNVQDVSKNLIKFPPGRLRQGFGPEVVWSLNVLADRALELKVNSEPSDPRVKLSYNGKPGSASAKVNGGAGSITVGQPFVGGGLTTRPLGSYQIDDTSLLFEDDHESDDEAQIRNSNTAESIDPKEWYREVERSRVTLEIAQSEYELDKASDLNDYLKTAIESRQAIQEFMNQSGSLLEAISNRADRQLQILNGREKFMQNNLGRELDKFLSIWRDFSAVARINKDLTERVNLKTDIFEGLVEKLRQINRRDDQRSHELEESSKLRQMELMITRLEKENSEFDIKIDLLLTVYASLQAGKTNAI